MVALVEDSFCCCCCSLTQVWMSVNWMSDRNTYLNWLKEYASDDKVVWWTYTPTDIEIEYMNEIHCLFDNHWIRLKIVSSIFITSLSILLDTDAIACKSANNYYHLFERYNYWEYVNRNQTIFFCSNSIFGSMWLLRWNLKIDKSQIITELIEILLGEWKKLIDGVSMRFNINKHIEYWFVVVVVIFVAYWMATEKFIVWMFTKTFMVYSKQICGMRSNKTNS